MANAAAPKFVVGALLMAGAALTFASMHGIIRLAGTDMHPFQVAFFRWFFGIAFLIPFVIKAGPGVFKTKHRKLYLYRAALTTGATLTWFYALSVMPLAEATALNFTIPLFTTMVAAFFLGEYVGVRRWTATCVGFIGVLVILRPGISEFNPVVILPIAAALMIAFNLNIMKFTTRTDSTMTIVVYNAILAAPMTAIPAAIYWQTPSWEAIGLAATIALFATAAHFMLTASFRYGDASALVPFDYLRLPFVALIGYLYFSEIPDKWTWIGGGIIAAATIYIARREARLARQRDDVTAKPVIKAE
jgi:drug/metabolite transporter (DMT)-like permease